MTRLLEDNNNEIIGLDGNSNNEIIGLDGNSDNLSITPSEYLPGVSLLSPQRKLESDEYFTFTFDEFKDEVKTSDGWGQGSYVFVIMVNEPNKIRIVLDDEQLGGPENLRIGHFSLLTEFERNFIEEGGKPVKYAGTIEVGHHKIKYWSNDSGHFHPLEKFASGIAKKLGLPYLYESEVENDEAHFKPMFGGLISKGGNKKKKKKKKKNKKKNKKKKVVRKHQGINQSNGRLKKGYKYSGKKLKSGLAQIIKIKSRK